MGSRCQSELLVDSLQVHHRLVESLLEAVVGGHALDAFSVQHLAGPASRLVMLARPLGPAQQLFDESPDVLIVAGRLAAVGLPEDSPAQVGQGWRHLASPAELAIQDVQLPELAQEVQAVEFPQEGDGGLILAWRVRQGQEPAHCHQVDPPGLPLQVGDLPQIPAEVCRDLWDRQLLEGLGPAPAPRPLLLLILLCLWLNPILSQLGNGDASRLRRVVAELLRGSPWRLADAALLLHGWVMIMIIIIIIISPL